MKRDFLKDKTNIDLKTIRRFANSTENMYSNELIEYIRLVSTINIDKTLKGVKL